MHGILAITDNLIVVFKGVMLRCQFDSVQSDSVHSCIQFPL